MASRTDLETIETILNEKEYARKHRVNYIKHLSLGKRMYKSAISTMVSVGALQIVLSVLGIVWESIEFYLFFANTGDYSINITDKIVLFYGISILIYIVTLALGIKLYTLSATPAFVLGALLFVIPVNAAIFILVTGLIPQVLSILIVALSIIGLTRWSAYNYWFNDVNTKAFNKK